MKNMKPRNLIPFVLFVLIGTNCSETEMKVNDYLSLDQTRHFIANNPNFQEIQTLLPELRLKLKTIVEGATDEQKRTFILFNNERNERKMDENELTESLSLMGVTPEIIHEDPVMQKIHSLTVQLLGDSKKVSSLETIKEAFISIHSPTTNPKMRESEFEHCLNVVQYNYSLALMDCFDGPPREQDSCLTWAEIEYTIAQLNCLAECSMSTPNCHPYE